MGLVENRSVKCGSITSGIGHRYANFAKVVLLCFFLSVSVVYPTICHAGAPETIGAYAYSCGTDAEIEASKRSAIEAVATEFVRMVLGPDPGNSYADLTSDAQRNVSRDQLVAMAGTLTRMGPYKELHVAHSYFVHLTGGSSETRVVCGNLSRPENWVAVTAKPVPEQAHVVVEGRSVNNTTAFILWLMPEQQKWRVEYFQSNVSTMAEKSADDLWHQGQVERDRHHNFNACILYTAAYQLAQRGPNF
jgi:hypothetical protein